MVNQFSTKVPRQSNGGRKRFYLQTKKQTFFRQLDSHMQKKMNLDPYLTLYMTTQKSNKDLRAKMLKHF